MISGCSSNETYNNNNVRVRSTPKKNLNQHINKIKRMIDTQSLETTGNSLQAIKAFNYHPKVFDTCITNKVNYYYSKTEMYRDVTVKDCLFASRIETIANYSIHNTNYAADVLSRRSARENKTPSEVISPVHISKNFSINRKATISKVIELVATNIDFNFSLVNQDSLNYSLYQFKSKPYETPMGFLTRIDREYSNISININIKDKSISLSFLAQESFFESLFKSKKTN